MMDVFGSEKKKSIERIVLIEKMVVTFRAK